MKKKVILVGLNEINFDFIQAYIAHGYLKTFKKLFEANGYLRTSSESEYDLWEPWIQWVSIHTGKMYSEHKIFRLGDIVEEENKGLRQIWEIAESKGLKVGAISPFNGRNDLKNPAFFVPDPWTKTTPAGSSTLVGLSNAVSAAVNNNASSKLGAGSIVAFLKGFGRYVPFSQYPKYLSLATKIRRKATKPAILDNVLADTFIQLWKETRPDFSSLFLNSGAHIQHHYMFNSKVYKGDQKNPDWYIPSGQDPLLDILTEYDKVLARLMELNCRLFIGTGLHQNPHDENTFYWRLKDHAEFLKLAGITGFTEIVPRMSRDFLVKCANEAQASQTQKALESITLASDGGKVFTVDNRGDSLFVELTYDKDLKSGSIIKIGDNKTDIDLFNFVAFVAIKNGEHDGIGYFIDTDKKSSPETIIPIKEVFTEIVNSFD